MSIFSGKSTYQLCLALFDREIGCCVFQPSKKRVVEFFYLTHLQRSELEKHLNSMIKQFGKQLEVHLVLDPAQSQLLTMPRPAVNQAKLYESIKWQLQERVDNIDVIEYQYCQSADPGSLLVYVVLKEVIDKIRQLIKSFPLRLASITVMDPLFMGLYELSGPPSCENSLFILPYSGAVRCVVMKNQHVQAVYLLPELLVDGLSLFETQLAQILSPLAESCHIAWFVEPEIYLKLMKCQTLQPHQHQRIDLKFKSLGIEKVESLALLTAIAGGGYYASR